MYHTPPELTSRKNTKDFDQKKKSRSPPSESYNTLVGDLIGFGFVSASQHMIHRGRVRSVHRFGSVNQFYQGFGDNAESGHRVVYDASVWAVIDSRLEVEVD